MRRIAIAAMALLVVSAGPTHAEVFKAEELRRQVDALLLSLIGWPAPRDRDVIVPPGDIDPKMAIAPRSGSVIRVIPAPDRPQQR